MSRGDVGKPAGEGGGTPEVRHETAEAREEIRVTDSAHGETSVATRAMARVWLPNFVLETLSLRALETGVESGDLITYAVWRLTQLEVGEVTNQGLNAWADEVRMWAADPARLRTWVEQTRGGAPSA